MWWLRECAVRVLNLVYWCDVESSLLLVFVVLELSSLVLMYKGAYAGPIGQGESALR